MQNELWTRWWYLIYYYILYGFSNFIVLTPEEPPLLYSRNWMWSNDERIRSELVPKFNLRNSATWEIWQRRQPDGNDSVAKQKAY